MYKYLLFDADNTLLDFDEAERLALTDTLNECPLGFSEEIHKRYHQINKEEWEKLERKETTLEKLRVNRFVRLSKEFGYGEELGVLAAKMYAGNLGKYAPKMPDADTVLEKLCEKYDIYIITNGVSSTQQSRFSIAGFDKCAKHIFVSEEIGVAKPEKRYFDIVTEYIGDKDLSKYLIIGDSLTSDISGADLYGIDSAWLCGRDREDPRPKYKISGLSELLNIL